GGQPRAARTYERMTSTVWFALLGPFSVYLLPIVLPHAVKPWGLALLGEIRGSSNRNVLWIVADVGLFSRRPDIGDVQDAVYVLRVAHGGEVFRKYLPRYSRSGVTFLGSRYFA